MMGKNTNLSKKRIFRHPFYKTSRKFLERRIAQKNGIRSFKRVLATLLAMPQNLLINFTKIVAIGPQRNAKIQKKFLNQLYSNLKILLPVWTTKAMMKNKTMPKLRKIIYRNLSIGSIMIREYV